jgi:enediyne biosynthesis protein E4
VQGGPLKHRSGPLPSDRLYRNLGKDLHFEDITERSGVVATGYGMGIATGDIDNDGDLDVFLANYGRNQLFLNLGHGQFQDISDVAGIVGTRDGEWSVAASFADIDNDGLLDIYVVNYLDYRIAHHKPCQGYSSRVTYCAPRNYEASADQLLRNRGNGRFEDVSHAAGIDTPARRGMGAIAADFNGDGRVDFYVANDAEENFLWINRGDGRFENDALLSGTAVNAYGVAEASMGIVAEDFDQDRDFDLFITDDTQETNTLYVNDGKGWFEDQSVVSGLALPSLPWTGFGIAALDVENDGDLDLFVANGAVRVIEAQRAAGIEPPLQQPDQLYVNDGMKFVDARDSAFATPAVSRGVAMADLDNDGDSDLVVTVNNGPVQIFRNDGASGHWLGAELIDRVDRPHGTQALLWLESRPGAVRRISTDGSYASANDHRRLFGLGSNASPQYVVVRWPDGTLDRFGPLAADRYHRLERHPAAPEPATQ